MMFFRNILSKWVFRAIIGTTAVSGQSIVEEADEQTRFIDLSDYLPNTIEDGERIKNTSTVEGMGVHNTATKNQSFKTIAEYHVFAKKWKIVSYDWGINWEGIKYILKRRDILGYHISGLNRNSYATVLLGNYSLVESTPEMKEAFHSHMVWAFNEYNLQYLIMHTTAKRILDKRYTECPGLNAQDWIRPYEFDSRSYPDRFEELSPVPLNKFITH